MEGLDRERMRLALEVSRGAWGRTGTNPPVGAVVTNRAGKLAGVGWTGPAGGPHAEVVALAAAGDRARDGTIHVTLEPCARTGRTGPCTEALVAAGVRRVVYGVEDPHPDGAGGAIELREKGIDVLREPLGGEVANGPMRAWLHHTRTGRPYVTWKFAATLDGRSAAPDGTSRWISGPTSRRMVHDVRLHCDAVIVGTGTVLVDDPSLTARGADGDVLHRPVCVVVGRRTPPPNAAVRARETDGRFRHIAERDPRRVLELLGAEGHKEVLLEGGPRLAAAFLARGCVDRVLAHLGPTLLGAGSAVLTAPWVATLTDQMRLTVVDCRLVDGDVHIEAVPVAEDGTAGSVAAGSAGATSEEPGTRRPG